MTLVYRLSPLTTPPVEKSPIMNLTLQEILIIGNCNDQVVFEATSHIYHLPVYKSYILSNSSVVQILPCMPFTVVYNIFRTHPFIFIALIWVPVSDCRSQKCPLLY